ncbi:peroxidase-related enzyme [Calidithermus roseus]|uniref:Putative peroxidase-related enzyme n=1 Tax=Calidithermus roseus TaxID=1644118 RepID=A0A399EUS0_9DEIN|nr:peroxidase-related enzyme [Calidithermus roseus]RIH87375.1 putative peroxidase-related enzyme [Calidithermus roseus]
MASNAVIDQVLALSQEGKTPTEIARETGMPFRQVRSLLSKAGQIVSSEAQAEAPDASTSPSKRAPQELPEALLAEIESRYQQGETAINIATSLELNYQRVLRALREKGLLRQERRGRRGKGSEQPTAAEPSQALTAEVLQLAQQGMSPVQIARSTGLKIRQINTILQRSARVPVAPAPSRPQRVPRHGATSWLRVPQPEELPEQVQTLFGKFVEKTGFVPNVIHNFALLPEHLLRWFGYYDYLMRSEGHLSRREREMIAVVVSSHNQCEYCLASHSAYLRDLTGDPVLPDVLIANYRRAEISPRERALLDFALKITTDSPRMEETDLEPLRSVGLSDEAIFEAAQVAAMFNFTNRLANALGWKPNAEYYAMHRAYE